MFLNVALDDSSGRTGYVAYSAYAGFSSDWEGVSRDWVSVLRAKNMASLHTGDYLYSNPCSNAADPDEHAWSLLEPFAATVHRHHLFGMCVAVNQAAYAAMGKDNQRLCGKPEDLAFEILIHGLLMRVHGLTDPNNAVPVSLMVDDGQGDMRLYGVYRSLRQRKPEIRRLLHCISFGNDEMYPAIQCADMLGNCLQKGLSGRPFLMQRLTRSHLPRDLREFIWGTVDVPEFANLVAKRTEAPGYVLAF